MVPSARFPLPPPPRRTHRAPGMPAAGERSTARRRAARQGGCGGGRAPLAAPLWRRCENRTRGWSMLASRVSTAPSWVGSRRGAHDGGYRSGLAMDGAITKAPLGAPRERIRRTGARRGPGAASRPTSGRSPASRCRRKARRSRDAPPHHPRHAGRTAPGRVGHRAAQPLPGSCLDKSDDRAERGEQVPSSRSRTALQLIASNRAQIAS